MKIDLGVGSFSVPDTYLPTTMLIEGPEDVRQPLSLGPSVAKEQALKHRRLVSVSVARAEVDVATEAPLRRALADIVQRSRAKVANDTVIPMGSGVALTAELTHVMAGSPVVTYSLLTAHAGLVWAVNLTVIDEPKAKAAGKQDFEGICKSMRTSA